MQPHYHAIVWIDHQQAKIFHVGLSGADQINLLTSQTGMSREQLLSSLSEHLPNVINHLTPGGRVPTADEVARQL